MKKTDIEADQTFGEIIQFIRHLFDNGESIPLHEPVFEGNERKYVMDAIDSTYVSSIGAYVDRFEEMIEDITGADFAVAAVNGTSALHMALILVNVKAGEEVITQPLSFVATANAIRYTGADPVFLDVDKDTLGLSPQALKDFLRYHTEKKGRDIINRTTGKKISCCVPMHTFGFPARIKEIVNICQEYDIPVIEDAAESLGSYVEEQHTGTFGLIGAVSLNGNKIVTSGGGGALITNDKEIAQTAKHLTTTAKVPHKWAYIHDQLGYNYRMPNLNAALACAQLEQLDKFLQNKRTLAESYKKFFNDRDITFLSEQAGVHANYWLNTILFNNVKERDSFLAVTNEQNILCRPAWELLNKLEMYKKSFTDDLLNASWLADRIVNIPSSVRI